MAWRDLFKRMSNEPVDPHQWDDVEGDVGRPDGLGRFIEWVPTEYLRPMLEHDRDVNGMPGRSDAVLDSLNRVGFKEPIWVDFNDQSNQAHVSEGNHRLTVAVRGGIPAVPVSVLRSGRVPSNPSILRPHTYVGGEVDHRGQPYVPEYMKPSDIGMPTTEPWNPRVASPIIPTKWDVLRVPRDEYVGEYPVFPDPDGMAHRSPEYKAWREKTSPEFEAVRQREKDWDRAARNAMATGRMTPEEVTNLGYRPVSHEGDSEWGAPKWGRWRPLPSKLYHVTSNLPAVLRSGVLRSPDELDLDGRGRGLGGGTQDTISLTDSLEDAQNIRRAILEGADVASGRLPIERLVEMARTGEGATEPWLKKMFGDYDWSKGNPRGLDDLLHGRKPFYAHLLPEDHPLKHMTGGFSTLPVEEWAKHGYHPYDDAYALGTPGNPIYNAQSVYRHLTPEEKAHEAFDWWRNPWAPMRGWSGGPSDPMFTGVDSHWFANLHPHDVGVVEVEPVPNGHGYPMSSLGEWRIPTGEAVNITGVNGQPHEPDPERLGSVWDVDDDDGDGWVTCSQGHEHWGRHGAAGMLFSHQSPEGARYLLQKRDPWVQHGGTWSVPGGAINRSESPYEGALREATEEWGPVPQHTVTHTSTDDHGNWAYHTVHAQVPQMFEPTRQFEADGHAWMTKPEIDALHQQGQLHPGFASYWQGARQASTPDNGPSVDSRTAMTRPLYHGTLLDHLPSIQTHGLVPGVGDHVDEAYGDLDAYFDGPDAEEAREQFRDENLTDLNFMADKRGLGKAVGAMKFNIAKKLGLTYSDITPTHIRNHGLIVKHPGEMGWSDDPTSGNHGQLDYRPDDSFEGEPWENKEGFEGWQVEHPYTVEPGDYYTDSRVGPKGLQFLHGPALIRFLQHQGHLPTDRGSERPPWYERDKQASVENQYQPGDLLFYNSLVDGQPFGPPTKVMYVRQHEGNPDIHWVVPMPGEHQLGTVPGEETWAGSANLVKLPDQDTLPPHWGSSVEPQGTNPVYYHAAPQTVRDSIAQHGLDFNRGAPRWNYEPEMGFHPGNFLFHNYEDADDYGENELGEPYDVWEVKAGDLPAEDDEETGSASVIRHPVPPAQLRRLPSTADEAPDKGHYGAAPQSPYRMLFGAPCPRCGGALRFVPEMDGYACTGCSAGYTKGDAMKMHRQLIQPLGDELRALPEAEHPLGPLTGNILDPVRETLDPAVFDDAGDPRPHLKPALREWLLDAIYNILEVGGYEGPERWASLYLTGSLTTYQYADHSDCDISIFVNHHVFPEWSRAEMIGLMVEHCDGLTLPGTPHELQVYVVAKGIEPSDLYQPGLRSGYDLIKDEWIVPPERERAHNVAGEDPEGYATGLMAADKMERLIRYEPDKAALYYRQLHRKRMADQTRSKGDYATSNLIYKMLDNRGLFDQLRELGVKIAAEKTAMPYDDDPHSAPPCPECGHGMTRQDGRWVCTTPHPGDQYFEVDPASVRDTVGADLMPGDIICFDGKPSFEVTAIRPGHGTQLLVSTISALTGKPGTAGVEPDEHLMVGTKLRDTPVQRENYPVEDVRRRWRPEYNWESDRIREENDPELQTQRHFMDLVRLCQQALAIALDRELSPFSQEGQQWMAQYVQMNAHLTWRGFDGRGGFSQQGIDEYRRAMQVAMSSMLGADEGSPDVFERTHNPQKPTGQEPPGDPRGVPLDEQTQALTRLNDPGAMGFEQLPPGFQQLIPGFGQEPQKTRDPREPGRVRRN